MKLNIFTSTINDGVMSNEKNLLENLSKEERELLFKTNVKRFLSKYNLNSDDAIFLSDNEEKITSHVATFNNKKIKSSILILKDNTVNLPILIQTDDDPVIVASAKTEDEKTVAVIGKASLKNLSNNLIHEMTESLMKETNAATFEMTFYIGPCPSKETYLIKNKKDVENKIFEKAQTVKNNKLYLDLRYAIFNELYLEIVDPNNIYFSSTDTVLSPDHFSKIGNKKGKQITCVVFTNEEI